MDEKEGFVDLVVPYEGHEVLHHRMDDWRANAACPHEEMELVSERISNWSGVEWFRKAIDEAGEHRFPVLASRLPRANGGFLEPEEAAAMLSELRDLAGSTDLGRRTLLVGEESDRPILQHTGSGQGVFGRGVRSRFRMGLDPDGFFVEDTETDSPVELFRSSGFAQQEAGEGEVRFTALDHDGHLTVPWPYLLGQSGRRPPKVLRVREAALTAEDVRYIVSPLITVCQAAVDTDARVHWC
ncbi:hypothetical protein [Nocardiopsis sp. M1B1]|uniref:hypothetical protein n=1 Tax=Nocardiopsis sp. M1B1 TaxID=3450454 RepID=UPI0040391D31